MKPNGNTGHQSRKEARKVEYHRSKGNFHHSSSGWDPHLGNGGELLDCHGNSGDREHAPYKEPSEGAQVLVEKVVETLYSFVESTMGKDKVFFAPYIGTLFLFSFFSNMLGLFGLRAPTADINTTACWAFIEFMLVQIFSIKRKGVIGRIKGLCDPPIVTPLNLISEFSTPVSMAFRHFGNIAAGLIITTLLYGALTGLTHMVFGANFQIPILAIGLPAVLSVYFDLFTAFMQAFIISMLTMVFTSICI